MLLLFSFPLLNHLPNPQQNDPSLLLHPQPPASAWIDGAPVSQPVSPSLSGNETSLQRRIVLLLGLPCPPLMGQGGAWLLGHWGIILWPGFRGHFTHSLHTLTVWRAYTSLADPHTPSLPTNYSLTRIINHQDTEDHVFYIASSNNFTLNSSEQFWFWMKKIKPKPNKSKFLRE